MLMPSQYAEKFPATSPDRMLSEAPPSLDEVTTSWTWRDSVEVKTFTSSGMIAPASVPQEMIARQFPPERVVATEQSESSASKRRM